MKFEVFNVNNSKNDTRWKLLQKRAKIYLQYLQCNSVIYMLIANFTYFKVNTYNLYTYTFNKNVADLLLRKYSFDNRNYSRRNIVKVV